MQEAVWKGVWCMKEFRCIVETDGRARERDTPHAKPCTLLHHGHALTPLIMAPAHATSNQSEGGGRRGVRSAWPAVGCNHFNLIIFPIGLGFDLPSHRRTSWAATAQVATTCYSAGAQPTTCAIQQRLRVYLIVNAERFRVGILWRCV